MNIHLHKTSDNLHYHEKRQQRQIKSVTGDDDSINAPVSPKQYLMINGVETPSNKNFEMMNILESLKDNKLLDAVKNKNEIKVQMNDYTTNTQQILLNETVEGTFSTKKEETTSQHSNNSQGDKQDEQNQRKGTLDIQFQDQIPKLQEKRSNKEEQQHQQKNKCENDEDDFDDNDDNQNKKNGDMSRRSLHNSSSLQLEDYFNQDADKKKKDQMDRIVNDLTKFKSYFVKFRLSLFFEFFFYHALFVIFFGPFANPIIYQFGKGLPRNLFFWGANQGFIYQTYFYIMSLSAIVLYSYYQTNYVYFQSELIYLFLGMIYRIYTISTKYATYDPFKIEAIRHHVFQSKDLKADFFLLDWREQKDRIIYEEIYFAQRAYDIDPSWFYLEFIVNPEDETRERVNKHNFVLSCFHQSKDQSFQPQPINITNKDTEVFYIYGIIKEIVDNFQEKYKFSIKHVESVAIIYSFIRCLIPTICKLADEDIHYIKNSQWYEWIICFNIAFLTYKLYYFTVWTILQGIIDMKRKIYMMEQMAFMISPRKLRSIDVDKIFPTINIFKSSNLKAWQLMRHVCQEYGKRYNMRVQANFSGMVIVIISAIVILALYYTNIIELEQSFTIVIVLETVGLMILLVLILYYGAKINEQFDIHDTILTYNKSIVMDIYRMRRRYFCEEFKTTNYLYNKAIQKIKDEVAMLKLPQPCGYLKEIVDSYDTHIDELKFDQRQNPFKIGSLKITNGLLESGIIGVISVIVAIVGKFLQNKLSEE